MATVSRENIGNLHEKISITLSKDDYLPAFQKALKEYGKKANIPGFRKGMVPAGLIKKMYGASVFTDEVLRTVDRELVKYLETEKLDIFAQPLPMEMNMAQLDMNNPADYKFDFEVGMKPAVSLPELGKANLTRFVIEVTDEMIDNEITRLQNRYGNMSEPEAIDNEENVLNLLFTESDAQGNTVEGGITKDNSLLVKYFTEGIRKDLMGKKKDDKFTIQLTSAFEDKEREWVAGDLGLNKENAADLEKYFTLTITKVGILEKRNLDEEFFSQLYPGQEVKTEADFRNKIKEEISNYWASQARNQIHDQLYHQLLDHSQMDFPEAFLKKWMQTQGENPKTTEEVEAEFPQFRNQLKWTLITDKIVTENAIQVEPDNIRDFAKQQLFGYMGMNTADAEQPWVNDYIERMMKDRKYVEDAFTRIQTQKIFEWAETQINPTDQSISVEEFTKMVENHHH